jgi:hypothetical protein
VKDSQLKALIRKNTQQATRKKPQSPEAFDPTLGPTRGDAERDDRDAKQIFKEMKRREF